MSAMECTDARALLTRYLDDELTEDCAAPLRTHLLACPGCRALVQEGRSMATWFVAPEPSQIPEGFAARVAHRAVTGNPGALVALPPVGSGSESAMEPGQEENLRGFVLSAIALAALVLLSLSIAMRRLELPGGEGLEAKDTSREQAVEALRVLNEGEGRE